MSWFLIALIGPLLYAVTNHTDKYLLSKKLKTGEIGSLVIFSSIFSILALPIVFYIYPSVFQVSLVKGIILALNGALLVGSLILYFHAIQRDEASFVVPFYQTIPVFGFILGYFILGETLSFNQVIASLVIILGALVMSFELGIGKIRFKKAVVLLMLGASLFYAVNGVVFKLIAVDDGFWPSIFWSLVGKIMVGIWILLFIPTYRRQFMGILRRGGKIFLINSINEVLAIIADATTSFAILLAPVVLVLLVNAFQPFFVFIMGVLLTLFLPNIGKESLVGRRLAQKIVGIGLIVIGTYFLGI